MKVRILKSGPYTDFANQLKAQRLDAGAVVEFPEWYGRDLVRAGLAQEEQPVQPETPAEETAGAPVDASSSAGGESLILDIPDEDLISMPSGAVPPPKRGKAKE